MYIPNESEAWAFPPSDFPLEAGEPCREIVHGVHGGTGFHGRRAIEKPPVTMPGQLHYKYFEENLCKLLPYAAPEASSEGNEAKPGCILGVWQHEPVGIKFLLVGEDVGHVVRVTDAVDNIPALGNLVSLQEMNKSKKSGKLKSDVQQLKAIA